MAFKCDFILIVFRFVKLKILKWPFKTIHSYFLFNWAQYAFLFRALEALKKQISRSSIDYLMCCCLNCTMSLTSTNCTLFYENKKRRLLLTKINTLLCKDRSKSCTYIRTFGSMHCIIHIYTHANLLTYCIYYHSRYWYSGR